MSLRTAFAMAGPCTEATLAASTSFFLRDAAMRYGVPCKMHMNNAMYFKVQEVGHKALLKYVFLSLGIFQESAETKRQKSVRT